MKPNTTAPPNGASVSQPRIPNKPVPVRLTVEQLPTCYPGGLRESTISGVRVGKAFFSLAITGPEEMVLEPLGSPAHDDLLFAALHQARWLGPNWILSQRADDPGRCWIRRRRQPSGLTEWGQTAKLCQMARDLAQKDFCWEIVAQGEDVAIQVNLEPRR